ncbi:MAG: undecaprenyl-phosphate glucose phosphotransferase [Gammaproteobacteria bacterium]|nr:undecaprenyl-phosphate glucose phosphotransferase [Gammaproteobacteria bacterium]
MSELYLNTTKNKAIHRTVVIHRLHQLKGLLNNLGILSRAIDLLLIYVSLWSISLIYNESWQISHNIAIAYSTGLFILFATLFNLYPPQRKISFYSEIFRLYVSWIGTTLGLLLLVYATKTPEGFPQSMYLTWLLVTPCILTLWHVLIREIISHRQLHGINNRRVAIVGAREVGLELAETIEASPSMGYQFVGFFDDRSVTGTRPLTTKSFKVLGQLVDVIAAAKSGEIDVVYITLPLRAEERIQQLILELSDTTASVHIVPDFFARNQMSTSLGNIGNLTTIAIHETPFYGTDGWIKRVEDIMLSFLILGLIIIPMLIIAFGVKLTSSGPILFKQRRYGLQGQEIEVWKFRTMSVCENGDTVCQATRDDDRITPLGKFLRRTSLDELPQFINVLQGTMSIVGPRPHAVVQNEEYRKIIKGYMLRHKVKPGITGWAQINGWRGETKTLDKMKGRIQYDLTYIRNWSLSLDLKIIFLTLFKGFVNKNAY